MELLNELDSRMVLKNHPIGSMDTISECFKCSGTGFKITKQKLSSSSKRLSNQKLTCKSCDGSGSRKITIRNKPKLRPFRPLYKWIPSGPSASFEIDDPTMFPDVQEMLCALSGNWCIYQLENGHRYTTDDVFTAAMAVKMAKKPKHYIDIGTGLGSVLMMVNWGLYNDISESVGLEAQSRHVSLAKKSLIFNGISDKCKIIHGDLRQIEDYKLTNTFDLVTGTPPYFPPQNGILPTISGRGMCAFELRGGIEVYFNAATKLLRRNSDSRFVICQTSIEIKRTEKCALDYNMKIIERWDIYGKIGKLNPLFCVFCCCWDEEIDRITQDDYVIKSFNVRDVNDKYSDEMIEVMELLGKPIPRDHFSN